MINYAFTCCGLLSFNSCDTCRLSFILQNGHKLHSTSLHLDAKSNRLTYIRNIVLPATIVHKTAVSSIYNNNSK